MSRFHKFANSKTKAEYTKAKQIILSSYDICALCKRPVDKAYKYPHPLSAVVDHIVPIAKGGDIADINNLQLAHSYCNRKKSDKLEVIKEQSVKKKRYYRYTSAF
jgi:5-methylcytosine-specific restriction endonuclease McrA